MFLSALGAAAHKDYKGLGTPLPFCAKVFTACLRCTSLWRCAGLPVGIALCAGTMGPGSKGCDVSRTSRGSHLTGGLTVPMRSGRIGHARAEATRVQDPTHACAVLENRAQGPSDAQRWSGHPCDPLSQRALTGAVLLVSLRRITVLSARALTNRWVVLLASSLSTVLPVTTPWRSAPPLHATAVQHKLHGCDPSVWRCKEAGAWLFACGACDDPGHELDALAFALPVSAAAWSSQVGCAMHAAG